MLCSNCDKDNPEGSLFCQHCGEKLEIENRNQNHQKKPLKTKKGLFWKIPVGITITCIVLVMLLYAFSSDFRNGFNSSSGNNKQMQSSNRTTFDITESVIDINCDNKQGGSGTILTETGVVLTNNHVISGASICYITLPDKSTGTIKAIYTAEPLSVPNLSKQYDLAFLRITEAFTDKDGKTWGSYPIDFPAFNFSNECNAYKPKLGESIKIYGYPVTSGGYNLTVTDGIVSSFDDYGDILTSAKIDSGNSGGLAVNNNGCFIGVPSAVVSGEYQNLGVIIPYSIINEFANKVDSSSLESAKSDWSPTQQSFDSTCLSLKNEKMYGNSYYSPNPTYIASLYNGCSQEVKNVVIKVNFYPPNSTIDTTPSDTQYVNLGISYLGSGDAHAINGTITTPYNTSGNFNWDAQIYSAEEY
ncbi:MAG TPA: trypsin-like peptidase domain-containing protein [Patescibacteria group bacterium]|nr:trypsin-like peptidase domain-containing protein [Patescibacteria group bacterium]